MGAVIGAVLPLALGVAISPVPMIATILVLLSPRAKTTSLTFLAGWLVGVVLTVVVFTLLGAILPEGDPTAPKPVAGAIEILLGVGLLLLAGRGWRRRPKDGADAPLPGWLSAVDTFTPGRGFAIGFLLAAVNPKNLLLAAGAGVTIGTAGLATGQVVAVTAIFVLVAISTVATPVVVHLLAAKRVAGALQTLRDWLVQNNATIMTVLLLVIGSVVIGKGIGNL